MAQRGFATVSNAFQRVLGREAAQVTRLGNPLPEPARTRRKEAMAAMTSGRGFSTPAKDTATDSQGRTRGQRKRAARAAAMAKVSEVRAPSFMHSAARRRQAEAA
jgi:hypothetical protein